MGKSPRNVRAFFVTSFVFLASNLASLAHADERTEARRHFRHGMELVVAGLIDEGVAELEEAYAILPHPNVLYNIGRAYAEVGRYSEARRYFERYLESDPPDRDEVRGILSALDRRIVDRSSASAVATAATESETTPPPAATTMRVAGASPEQIAEMRATAAQLRAIAQVSGGAAPAARADELERLADAMERANEAAAHEAPPPESTGTESEPSHETEVTTESATPHVDRAQAPATSEGRLGVAASSQGDTYEAQVVSSSRFAQSPLDAASATTIITRQDIRLTGIVSFQELLRRAAGVQVMSMTPYDANVGIRGFNRPLSPRVVVLVNGRSVYTDALGVNFYVQHSIDVEDVERIEIIRGPASALYGANAFSGVINIITRAPGDEPGTDVSFGAGNGNAFRMHTATNGRSGDLGYRLSAGASQADNWTVPFSPTERVDLHYPVAHPNLALREAHTRADFRYRVSENVRLALEGGYSYLDTFAVRATGGFTNLYANGPTSYAMASLQTGYGSIRSFWNHYDYSVAQADQGQSPFRMSGNTVDVEAVFAREFRLGVPHNLHLGASYRWKQIDWSVLDTTHTQNHYATFFEDTLRLSDAVRLTGGFRMDRHPIIQKLIWSPRLALVVRPTEGQSFRISGTSSFRTMSFAETYFQSDFATPAATAVGATAVGSVQAQRSLGQPPLRPERIITAEVGYQNQENDKFDVDVTAYFNRVWDLMGDTTASRTLQIGDYANPAYGPYVGFDPATNRFAGAVSLFSNEPPRYNVFGSELGIRTYPIDGLDVYANYSFNYSYVTNPAPGQSRTEERQPRHMFNTGLQYRRAITRRVGFDVAADLHVYAKTIWPEVGITPSGLVHQDLPLPAFYLINARVGLRLLGDRLEIGVAATNLTNNRVRQHPFAQTGQARVLATVAARF